jgi:homocitrate synthase NifV
MKFWMRLKTEKWCQNMLYPTEKGNIRILDTTLRDGEQTPGVVFSRQNKLTIAEMLDRTGVHEVELGTPAIGKEEMECMKIITAQGFNYETLAWCRAVKADLEKAILTGTQGLHISFPVSDMHLEAMGKTKGWVLRNIHELLPYALDQAEYVTVGAQDASRADIRFLREFMNGLAAFPVRRVRIADTVGILNPISTFDLIHTLHKDFPNIPLEFHGHNDLGMATANSLVACKAGATCLDATVNGLGERAGNAPLEELVMALKISSGIDVAMDTSKFIALSEYVSVASGIQLPSNKPVIGSKALVHESGVHTDLILKQRETFQIIPASWIGKKEEEFVYGKHSGFNACKDFLKRNKLYRSDEQCSSFVDMLKRKSIRLKRNLTVAEMLNMARFDLPCIR